MLAVLAALVVLGAIRSGEDAARVVTYDGERYESAAVARQSDVVLAGAVVTGDTIDGQRVFTEPRTPPRVLFLLRPDREYDAFVLVEREP